LLTLISGCGISTGTKAPIPVDSIPSSGNTTVAPSGLQLGFVWQSDSHNLYPIMGVSGAAHYGSGVLGSSSTVVAAAASGSATGSWALLLNKDGSLQELGLPGSTSATLAAGVGLDSNIVFSPGGSAAAVVSGTTHAVLIVTGLPSKAAVATVQLPANAPVAGFAVSDAGTVLAGVKPAGSPGVQLGVISELRAYAAIGTVQGWGGATFVPGTAASPASEAAVVADSVAAQVAYVTNIGSGTAAMNGIGTAGLLQTAVGVAVSPDGQWAFVADSGKPQVVQVSLAQAGTTAPISIACACKPTQLTPLTSNGIYAMGSGMAGQPAWLLDTKAASPRTFFVPAIAAATGSQTTAASTTQASGGGR
jgi:hypothetical protein